jgi:hypothetical protein
MTAANRVVLAVLTALNPVKTLPFNSWAYTSAMTVVRRLGVVKLMLLGVAWVVGVNAIIVCPPTGFATKAMQYQRLTTY